MIKTALLTIAIVSLFTATGCEFFRIVKALPTLGESAPAAVPVQT